MTVDEQIYRAFEIAFSDISVSVLGTFPLALLVSLAACTLNVATERWHGCYSFDVDVVGIQKVHKNMVSRTGGIALLAGVLAVPVFGNFEYSIGIHEENRIVIFKLLLAAMPAFLAGIIEDLTKKVSVRVRFFSILVSAILAAWLLGAYLPRLDIWGLDGAIGLRLKHLMDLPASTD